MVSHSPGFVLILMRRRQQNMFVEMKIPWIFSSAYTYSSTLIYQILLWWSLFLQTSYFYMSLIGLHEKVYLWCENYHFVGKFRAKNSAETLYSKSCSVKVGCPKPDTLIPDKFSSRYWKCYFNINFRFTIEGKSPWYLVVDLKDF